MEEFNRKKEGYRTHLAKRKKQKNFKSRKMSMVNYRQLSDEFPYRNGYMINRNKNNNRLIRVYRYKTSEPEYKSGRRQRLNQSYMKDIDISKITNKVWKIY